MNKEIVIGMAMAVALFAPSTMARAQGLVEYTLGTANSASSTVKLGSVLNQKTGELSGHIIQKLPSAVASTGQKHVNRNVKVNSHSSASTKLASSNMVLSIQGGSISRPSGNSRSKQLQENTAANPKVSDTGASRSPTKINP